MCSGHPDSRNASELRHYDTMEQRGRCPQRQDRSYRLVARSVCHSSITDAAQAGHTLAAAAGLNALKSPQMVGMSGTKFHPRTSPPSTSGHGVPSLRPYHVTTRAGPSSLCDAGITVSIHSLWRSDIAGIGACMSLVVVIGSRSIVSMRVDLRRKRG